MNEKILVIITIVIMLITSFHSQAQTVTIIRKSSFSFEIDPIVPIALQGIGGHFIWQPKQSKHFVYGLAIIVKASMPEFIMNLDAKNKNQGWHYKINQGMGVEAEYYYSKPNQKWFSGIQLFTQEINLTNNNEPQINQHRTNIGMVVLTSGYKWYPFEKIGLYLKPWAGIGYTGIIQEAFSDKVIPNTIVGSHEYHIQPFTPFATVHIGYKF